MYICVFTLVFQNKHFPLLLKEKLLLLQSISIMSNVRYLGHTIFNVSLGLEVRVGC